MTETEIVSRAAFIAATDPLNAVSVSVPEVKLDEGFPVFPGSPLSVRTVRRFLKDSLSEEEQEFIGLSNTRVPPPAPVANRNRRRLDSRLIAVRCPLNRNWMP